MVSFAQLDEKSGRAAMSEQQHGPHPAWSHWSGHGAVISTDKMKPNMRFGGSPENPLLTPALLTCLIFQPSQVKSTLFSAKKVGNATCDIFNPNHWEGQAEEGCCSVLVLSLPCPWTSLGLHTLHSNIPESCTSLRLPLSYFLLWGSVSARPDVAAASTTTPLQRKEHC